MKVQRKGSTDCALQRWVGREIGQLVTVRDWMMVRLMAYSCHPFLIYAIALTLQQGCSTFMICKDLNAVRQPKYIHILRKNAEIG